MKHTTASSPAQRSVQAGARKANSYQCAAEGLRHHELFRGTTLDGGQSCTWTALTANSTMDNLRPLVPTWKDHRTSLIWMRGTYRANRGEWTTKVVALILPAPSRTRAKSQN